MKLSVDAARLARELDELGAISAEPAPVVTRVVYSEADLRAREYVKALCREAGLAIKEDAAGNTFARWAGADSALPAVATGSHIDAIPNAGRFDGTVGVLGGLEAIRALRRSGFAPRHSLDLIVFASEEPTRFGLGCFGSRLIAGTLPATAGESLKGLDGLSLNEARTQAGFHGDLASVRMTPGNYAAFVELHIEQGPILEQSSIDIGAVTAIAAPATLRIDLEGEGGHAGAVLTPQRRDAFLGAAEIALEVEKAAADTGAGDTVATTGICDIFPRAVNSIPARAHMEIDIRDIDGPRRDRVLAAIGNAAREVAARRRLTARLEVLNADPPAACNARIIEAIEQSCAAYGLASLRMISRAYHDSLFMSLIAPVSMIFIPCRNGYSHRPDEYSSPEAIGAGALVLADTLRRLAA